MLCYVTLRYVTLCYVMLCYVMLCYVMSAQQIVEMFGTLLFRSIVHIWPIFEMGNICTTNEQTTSLLCALNNPNSVACFVN